MFGLVAFAGLSGLSLNGYVGAAEPFPPAVELAELNGTNGFAINGVADSDKSGAPVSGGADVNGDGVVDLLSGAIGVDPGGVDSVGASYVVFGGSTVGANGNVELSMLDGKNGFVIYGIKEEDFAGTVGNPGDFNGDGFDDILIGATGADPNHRFMAGQGYLVYGGANVGTEGSFQLAVLNGANGFTLDGTHNAGHAAENLGSAGDMNGDGYDDLIIGAKWADPGGRADAGQSYVVFGGPNVATQGKIVLTALNGANGFVLNGIGLSDNAGNAIGNSGDFNGDGFDDVLIGAADADAGGRRGAGQSYVVFGRQGPFPAQLELSSLDGSNGFVVNGIEPLDDSGVAVNSAGDVNADGYDDIVIGAWHAAPHQIFDAGQSYVVFGGPHVGATGTVELADLNGITGVVINGVAEGDQSGAVVNGRLDINHDGVDDLIIGAHMADPGDRQDAGATYVVYGRVGLGTNGPVELSELNGENGFVLNGIGASDNSAATAAPGGDLNDDGIDDLLIGAYDADPNGIEDAGQAYVVFGRAADNDDDGIANDLDNCTEVANADQRDTNSDGFGNACDPDLDDNGVVNFGDLGLLKSVFLTTDADADLNGDEIVNFVDLGMTKSLFFLPPGPSGLVD